MRLTRSSYARRHEHPKDSNPSQYPEDTYDETRTPDSSGGNPTTAGPDTSDEEPLKSLGPFLGKLPRETRDTIYEYVLGFNKTPLARTTDKVVQESFIHWSFREQRFAERLINPLPQKIVDTNILTINKVIHSEALEALYRINTISLSVQQCQQIFKANDTLERGAFSGNVAMARHVLLRKGWSHAKRKWFRSHNTIDLDSLFTNLHSVFPRLRSLTVRTDHALRATTALFDIGVDLMECDQVRNVRFDAVGSLVAETKSGFIVRVEHRRITREWQRQMTEPLAGCTESWPRRTSIYCRIKRLIEAVEQGEHLDDKCRRDLAKCEQHIDASWQTLGEEIPQAFKACAFDSHEFWTYAVGRHLPFETAPSDNSDTDDSSDAYGGLDGDSSSDVAIDIIRTGGRLKKCNRFKMGGGKAPRRSGLNS